MRAAPAPPVGKPVDDGRRPAVAAADVGGRSDGDDSPPRAPAEARVPADEAERAEVGGDCIGEAPSLPERATAAGAGAAATIAAASTPSRRCWLTDRMRDSPAARAAAAAAAACACGGSGSGALTTRAPAVGSPLRVRMFRTGAAATAAAGDAVEGPPEAGFEAGAAAARALKGLAAPSVGEISPPLMVRTAAADVIGRSA